MAKKAGPKSSTISLAEAFALLAKHYPQNLAEEKHCDAIVAADNDGALQYDFDGPRGGEGDPTPAEILKRVTGRGGCPQLWPAPKVDLAGSAIHYHLHGRRCTLYRIRFPREYVEKLLPEPQKPDRDHVKSRRGNLPFYDREAIQKAGRDVLARGKKPKLKRLFYADARNLAEEREIKLLPPLENTRAWRRLLGQMYDDAPDEAP